VNVLTLDLLTPVITLGVVVLALPVTGLSWRLALRVSWPLGVAALTLLVVNSVTYAAPGIGQPDLEAGVVTALRLLAIALPGVLVFSTIDSVDLTDALVQQLHVPARFGYGALAATRLLPLLVDDWRSQAVAARARGVAARGPAQWARYTARRVLLLLVSALRRATRLAVALDARGFADAHRSTSRPSPWTAADWGWVVGGVVVAAAVVGLSVVLGSFDVLLV
jgi:energy-coupling factor transport system permease protein